MNKKLWWMLLLVVLSNLSFAQSWGDSLIVTTPSADPAQLGIRRLYDLAPSTCDDIGAPGEIKVCRVTVYSGEAYAWGSAWCATRASAFPALIQATRVTYVVDGQYIAPSRFWSTRSATCSRRRVILEGFEPGSRHQVRLIVDVAYSVSDGTSVVRAGRYELVLEIAVR